MYSKGSESKAIVFNLNFKREMKTENLPEIVTVKKVGIVCHECRKVIKKRTLAVYHWWIKKEEAYSHLGCVKK